MDPLTEREIRSSFVNCSKGDAKRMPVPRNLDAQPWDDLDFFGWTDPAMPGRAWFVTPYDDRLIGVALRYERGGTAKAQLCSICMTTHTGGGVSLLAASKTGDSGRRGNTVGIPMCTDLACSLYARNKKRPALGNRYREDLTDEQKAERVRTNLRAFVDRLYT
ncbi:FBP domain-containing protein [Nocardia vermiculata]|uniref:FBP domain-containing protein n=1 Tax=Nocardia vermiculata TaxID=257274 RepID=A0A846XVI2_9NOCA|nr:FBP domain-containing protein [Nocardia vermiculata]NKY50637.1 FBP domain-containing protein [Nocardia vermiculata]